MDETAKEVATNELMEYNSEETLYNPEKNIQIGVKYFADLKLFYCSSFYQLFKQVFIHIIFNVSAFFIAS